MRGEIIETGKTVDDAINSACEKLGCEREDCEWEIIDLPKKGFLGIKIFPAKVRVSVGTDDEIPAPPAPAPTAPKASAPPALPKAAPAQKTPERVPQAEKREQQKPPRETREPREQKRPAPPPAQTVQAEATAAAAPPSPEQTAKAELARDYLAGIIRTMDLSAEISIVWEESGFCLKISGNGLGAVIGRRGETLDSLQYLCGLVINRLEGDYLRVTVDCGDYRVKRKSTLEALARKLSAQVLKTNINKVLEPMNPFERRIIHATVSTIEGVSSTSVGEEPNRRVVITSPTAKNASRSAGSRPSERPRRPGDRDRKGRGGYDRDRGGRENRSGGRLDRGRDRGHTSSTVVPTAPPPNPPKEAEDKPLYGKIDLE